MKNIILLGLLTFVTLSYAKEPIEKESIKAETMDEAASFKVEKAVKEKSAGRAFAGAKAKKNQVKWFRNMKALRLKILKYSTGNTRNNNWLLIPNIDLIELTLQLPACRKDIASFGRTNRTGKSAFNHLI